MAYLQPRERGARRLAKEQGIAGRLRRRPADFLAEVDRRLLRFCPRCEEIAYPGAEEDMGWTRSGGPARVCHFCGEGASSPSRSTREGAKGAGGEAGSRRQGARPATSRPLGRKANG